MRHKKIRLTLKRIIEPFFSTLLVFIIPIFSLAYAWIALWSGETTLASALFEFSEKVLIYILGTLSLLLTVFGIVKLKKTKMRTWMFLMITTFIIVEGTTLYSLAAAGTAFTKITQEHVPIEDTEKTPENPTEAKYQPFEYATITTPFFAEDGQTAQEIAQCLVYTLETVKKDVVLTHEQIYVSEYSTLALKADKIYRTKDTNDNMNLTNISIISKAKKTRVTANEDLPISSNQRIIGIYDYELHDLYLFQKDEEKAYNAILSSIENMVNALISTVSEGELHLNSEICIKHLIDDCYPRLYEMKEITKEEKAKIELQIEAFKIILYNKLL